MASGDIISAEQVQPCDFAHRRRDRQGPACPAGRGAAKLCAASLPQALQSKLGLTCETALQASEQMPCRTFLEKAGSSYLVSLQIGAHGDIALLQIDSMLLFPIVDRLLGGSGGPSELSREVTEIEDQIAKEFVRLVCQELQAAWQSFQRLGFGWGTATPAQLQRLFSASDNALVFSFAVNYAVGGRRIPVDVADGQPGSVSWDPTLFRPRVLPERAR